MLPGGMDHYAHTASTPQTVATKTCDFTQNNTQVFDMVATVFDNMS